MDQKLQDFLSQSWKSLMRLDSAVAGLETGSRETGALDRMLGVVRGIREHAEPLSLKRLESLANAAETALIPLRNGAEWQPNTTKLLLDAVEAIKESIVGLEATGQESAIDHGHLIAGLNRIAVRSAPIVEMPSTNPTKPSIRIHTPIRTAERVENSTVNQASAAETMNRSFLVNPRVPDNLMQLVDELKTVGNQLKPSSQPGKSRTNSAPAAEEFNRIADELRETVATIWLQPTVGDAVQQRSPSISEVTESENRASVVKQQQLDSLHRLPTIESEALAGKTILVIDNSLFFRQLAIAALEAAGSSVTTAKDVSIAVELLARGERFDAILADVELPALHERDFARLTRNEHRHIPLIGLTTRSTAYGEARVRQAGFDRCVAKFHTRQLIAAIADLCPPTSGRQHYCA